MTNDLFKSKKDQLLDWIRRSKWVRTSDVQNWGCNNHSNRAMRNARQLCEEGAIFRMRKDLKDLRFNCTREDVYTIDPLEAEK